MFPISIPLLDCRGNNRSWPCYFWDGSIGLSLLDHLVLFSLRFWRVLSCRLCHVCSICMSSIPGSLVVCNSFLFLLIFFVGLHNQCPDRFFCWTTSWFQWSFDGCRCELDFILRETQGKTVPKNHISVQITVKRRINLYIWDLHGSACPRIPALDYASACAGSCWIATFCYKIP